MDYSKFMFEKKKAEKKQKKKNNVTKTKEVRMSPNISSHDLSTKTTQIRKFLSKKMRVKIEVIMKGREISKEQKGRDLLDRIVGELDSESSVESPITLAGRMLTVCVISK